MAETEQRTRTKREASIVDVAREAGVSAQTVSRVAGGKDVVKAETRERVLATMQKLGYRPNSAARALKSGRFRTIGVVMSGLGSYGNMHSLEGISNAAAKAGYSVILTVLGSITQAGFTGAFARFSEQAVDGVIAILEAHELAGRDVILPTGFPVVVIDSRESDSYPVVDADQQQGARLATEHLLDLGHSTVWHVRGPLEAYSADRRAVAWQQVLEERGCPVPEVQQGDWSAMSGYEIGLALAKNSEVTAVFAANDQMALGLLRAFAESGRRVPADISIVGFDDMAEAKNFLPPLTTIRQHFDQVGTQAVDDLIAAIDGSPRSGATRIPTELIPRASTAPPPSAMS
ncbi:MAG: LacI family DNA-binding transcriptional regulator [Microbacterium sp.]